MGTRAVAGSDGNFSVTVEASPVPVLADFWAPWCAPCELIEPLVDDLAAEFSGRLTVVKVNIDDSPGVASQYNIRSIPTLLFFKDGRVVDYLQSAVSRDQLRMKIEDVLTG